MESVKKIVHDDDFMRLGYFVMEKQGKGIWYYRVAYGKRTGDDIIEALFFKVTRHLVVKNFQKIKKYDTLA